MQAYTRPPKDASMRQPDDLKTGSQLLWSTGTGSQVWRVFQLCWEGKLSELRSLISEHPELVHCQHAYRTPLYFAVRENQIEVVRFLLEQGANPVGLAVNDSLIEIAKDRGYVEMQQMLEQWIHGTDVPSDAGEQLAQRIRDHDIDELARLLDAHPHWIRARDEHSNEAIHWATMTRQPDVIDMLLERGADIEAQRLDGARPLQLFYGDYHFRGWSRIASDWPHTPTDIVNHLLDRGAKCDLCTACHMGNLELVKQLVAEDPSCINRLSDSITYYLGSGSPINNASEAGHLHIVRYLLDNGADPNLPEPGIAPRGRALYSAIANQHYEIAELLLNAGSEVNQCVESSADALSRAISNRDQSAIDLLCVHGACREVQLLAYDGDMVTASAVFNVNPSLANDVVALANAAGEGHHGFVRLMLHFCPDLPKRVEFPSWLVAAKKPETNQLLFEYGMDPNRSDWLGICPMHQIARRGSIELAIQFVQRGAKLDVRDDDILSTPMAWAAKFGKLEMVQYFLDAGVPPQHAEDPVWARPIEWAKRRGHSEIVALLRQHDATESLTSM